MKTRLLASLAAVLIGASMITYGGTASADEHRVTICHAAGLAGTTHYNTLTISENAVYGRHGQAGHFLESGTPRAGHEEDYLGPCTMDETTTTIPEETTTTEATTTTVPDVTTTVPDVTTTAPGKTITEAALLVARPSTLPRTGSLAWPLVALGLGLVAAGGLSIYAARKGESWT